MPVQPAALPTEPILNNVQPNIDGLDLADIVDAGEAIQAAVSADAFERHRRSAKPVGDTSLKLIAPHGVRIGEVVGHTATTIATIGVAVTAVLLAPVGIGITGGALIVSGVATLMLYLRRNQLNKENLYAGLQVWYRQFSHECQTLNVREVQREKQALIAAKDEICRRGPAAKKVYESAYAKLIARENALSLSRCSEEIERLNADLFVQQIRRSLCSSVDGADFDRALAQLRAARRHMAGRADILCIYDEAISEIKVDQQIATARQYVQTLRAGIEAAAREGSAKHLSALNGIAEASEQMFDLYASSSHAKALIELYLSEVQQQLDGLIAQAAIIEVKSFCAQQIAHINGQTRPTHDVLVDLQAKLERVPAEYVDAHAAVVNAIHLAQERLALEEQLLHGIALERENADLRESKRILDELQESERALAAATAFCQRIIEQLDCGQQMSDWAQAVLEAKLRILTGPLEANAHREVERWLLLVNQRVAREAAVLEHQRVVDENARLQQELEAAQRRR